jgi:hypothetical protein
MIAGRTAIYARVSSEAQARENTIASQLASLRERVAADGFWLEPDDCFVDEGYSGSSCSGAPSVLRPMSALDQQRFSPESRGCWAKRSANTTPTRDSADVEFRTIETGSLISLN